MKASIEFTDSFYSALLNGKSVAEAYNLGFARIYSLFPTEREKFHLRGNGNHQDCIIPVQMGNVLDITNTLPYSQCHSPAMFFVGRQTEVQQVDCR